jgi:WD40-like Beta Propeller Repeat
MRRSLILMACALTTLVAGCAVANGATPRQSSAAHSDGLIAVAGVTLHTDIAAAYTMRSDGSQLHMLPIPASLLASSVAVSPDGKQLAVDGSAGPIYLIGTDGHGLRQLIPNASDRSFNVGAPMAWSPNGQWIVFRAYTLNEPQALENEAAIYAIRPNGTGLHQVLTGFGVLSLAWGPGNKLAFTGTPYPAAHWPVKNAGLWTVTVNATDARAVPGTSRLLATSSTQLSPFPATVEGWSPDGRSLLVSSTPRTGDLGIVPADGGQPRVLLHCPAQTCTAAHYLSGAAWSTDGRTVMFTVNPNDPTGNTSVRFYTVPAADGRLAQLNVSFMRVVTGLSWQPPS